jgi:hypothetical protein
VDEFLEALERNRSRQKEAALDANAFGLAVLGMMASQDEWRGTASDFLGEAKRTARSQGSDLRDAFWPKGLNKVWSALTKIKRTLLAEGIVVEKTRTAGERLITLRRVRVEPAVELPTKIDCDDTRDSSDDTPASTVTPESACLSRSDDSDDSDDTFPASPGEGV